MRILHVTPYYEEAWGFGGIPRVVGALARAQARAGHRVTVCTTDARDAHSRWSGAHNGSAGGVDVHAFHNLSNRAAYGLQLYAPVGMRRWLAEHAGAFDVAHLHAHRNLPQLIAWRACTRAGVPFVLAPHGTAPVLERRRLVKHAFDLLIGRRMMASAPRVMCVSNAERLDLISMGVAEQRLRVVGNPLDLEGLPPRACARERFRARHGLGNAPVIGFLGRITPRKEVPTLLRAFASMSDSSTRLVLAGNAPGLEADLSSLASRLGVAARVTRVGQLSGSERFELLCAADVIAYAGEREVFGLVAFEALACGTPVVVASDSGCGEWVSRAGGGVVVPPRDARALASALEQIMGARQLFLAQAEAASREARAWFAPAHIAARVVDIYRELVRNAQSSFPDLPRA